MQLMMFSYKYLPNKANIGFKAIIFLIYLHLQSISTNHMPIHILAHSKLPLCSCYSPETTIKIGEVK